MAAPRRAFAFEEVACRALTVSAYAASGADCVRVGGRRRWLASRRSRWCRCGSTGYSSGRCSSGKPVLQLYCLRLLSVPALLLEWSNWELLLGFSRVFTSSPTAPTIPLGIVGRRGKAAGSMVSHTEAGGFAVCVSSTPELKRSTTKQADCSTEPGRRGAAGRALGRMYAGRGLE
jgi:hypothetical protein